MKPQVEKWLYIFLRLGFGLLLIAASVDKILHPREFAEIVRNYRIFGPALSFWAAVFVPYLELLTGLILILRIWQGAAVHTVSLLFTGFTALVYQAYFRGLDIACGCFRLGDATPIGPGKLAENALLFLFAWILFILWKRTGAENG